MPTAYLHIPFCESRCVYCDFYSVTDTQLRGRFVDALLREIDLRVPVPPLQEFTSVYFGGGTPSLLMPAEVDRILCHLRSRITLTPDAEISMESNPGTIDDTTLAGYHAAGVTRLSIGVQSFDDADLRFLSRIHDSRGARGAVQAALRTGFASVGIDLMSALPGQTIDAWRRNLHTAIDLGVPHISCYALTLEEATPLARMAHIDPTLLPDRELDAALVETTMETLGAAGFRQYEVSNHARPGHECRHNLSTWALDDYLGFGPSAHGTWASRRTWNVPDLGRWMRMVEDGVPPSIDGETITPGMRQREHLFLSLRSGGLSLTRHRDEFGCDLMRERHAVITALCNAGLAVVEDETLRLTRAGFLLCDEICERLM